MIVKMSKVEIIGPKGLLEAALSLLKDLGIFQIEPAAVGFIDKGCEGHVTSFLPDETSLSEVLFLENLRTRLEELFSYLPPVEVRKSYIEPLPVIDTISKTMEKHCAACRDLHQRKEGLQKEAAELKRYLLFLATISSLLGSVRETPDLDFIGLTIKEPQMIGRLRELISRLTDFRFELLTETEEDGTIVGLITVEKGISEKVKKSLSDEHVPELRFPPAVADLTFAEKLSYVKERAAAVEAEIDWITGETKKFSTRWLPIYKRVKEWTDERLSLLKATAWVFETRMCFFINGWMPSGDVERLRKSLLGAFSGKVAIEEKEMLEEDLDRVPIVLRNRGYFKPFELLVKMLPLPKYTSFDPTPFIGVFFPVFFGMILGDAGYGLILLALSLTLKRVFRKKGDIRDGAKILLISSLYAIFFGILFGEFFGELGTALFGLEPLCVERRHAVIPMLYFSLSVGVVHVVLGLVLGLTSAMKKKAKKEAAFKLLNVLLIFCIIVLIASFFKPFPWLLSKPVIIVILVLTPLLFFTGGLLAPLELLKSIGNIVSYARIMAIGLASVLLAFVANRMAGMMGDVVIGVIAAGLLHTINIVLGVFSPTIHSLRLHYVEFFSKFVEHGGRRFAPFKKES
ncbi:MAG: ATPase [Nitrospirae bacterium]|nr:ATPase [Nitrospirota bacterium]